MYLYQSMYFASNDLVKADWFECTNDGLAFKHNGIVHPKGEEFTAKVMVPDTVTKPDQRVPQTELEVIETQNINWDPNQRLRGINCIHTNGPDATFTMTWFDAENLLGGNGAQTVDLATLDKDA